MQRSLKSIAIGTAIAVTAATSVSAQVSRPLPSSLHATLTPASSFRCGPHTLTYVVKSLSQGAGTGIRCVKFSEGIPGNSGIPRLAWYGEGNWNGATYRHVGHAFYNGSNLIGYASDIHGNGERFNNNFPGNLSIKILSSSTIRVTGAWNEEWNLVRTANYKPLPRLTTCGRYLDQYNVSDLNGSRRGKGLRCVLRVGAKNTTWFGNGEWDGETYSHLGTRSFNGYGASDICGSVFGTICNNFGWGSLSFAPVPGGFDVTGAWSEKWR